MPATSGRNVREFLEERDADDRSLDIIAGATVTILVIDDAIRRATVKMARALGLAGLGTEQASRAQPRGEVDTAQEGVDDWMTLIGDGSVRRLSLSVGDVTGDFAAAGKEKAAARPESDVPEERFIDLYAALVSVPVIGRSLLGDAEYESLRARLEPGQHALLIAANGLYSFKGSGFVRGGIFDRIQLAQGEGSVRFRDRHYKHLGEVAADLAQPFAEIGLFVVPADAEFDPAAPWTLQLLVQRAIGALDKDFLLYEISYTLPERYLKPLPASPVAAGAAGAGLAEPEAAPELWQRIWKDRIVDVAVLGAALIALTLIFFFQDWFARRPKLTTAVRVGFLLFIVAWLGGFAQAQLSVVNVLTFGNALITDFRWSYFLMDPLIFLLWCSTAIALIFGAGVCSAGWLLPLRRASGAAQQGGAARARAAGDPALGPARAALAGQICDLHRHLRGLVSRPRLCRAAGRGRTFKTTVILRFATIGRSWPGPRDARHRALHRALLLPLHLPVGSSTRDPRQDQDHGVAAPPQGVRRALPSLRPGMHGAGDPSGRAHQPERVPLLPALPAGLPRRAPLPADDPAPPQARAPPDAGVGEHHHPAAAPAGPSGTATESLMPSNEEKAMSKKKHDAPEQTGVTRRELSGNHGEDRHRRRGGRRRSRRGNPRRPAARGARRN